MINVLIAVLLMSAGFALYALFYYLRKNDWNGYANFTKLVVAACIIIIISSLLVFVPDVADLLKTVTGLDVNIDNSKTGFVTFGIALSALLSTKMNDKKVNENT